MLPFDTAIFVIVKLIFQLIRDELEIETALGQLERTSASLKDLLNSKRFG